MKTKTKDRVIIVFCATVMTWICFDHIHSPLSNLLPLWWRILMPSLAWAGAGGVLFLYPLQQAQK